MNDNKQPTRGSLTEESARRLAAMLTNRQREDILLLARVIRTDA